MGVTTIEPSVSMMMTQIAADDLQTTKTQNQPESTHLVVEQMKIPDYQVP